MINEIEYLKEMSILTIHEGDILILKVDAYLSDIQRELIHKACEPLTKPHDTKIMILERGMEIGVLRQEEGEQG